MDAGVEFRVGHSFEWSRRHRQRRCFSLKEPVSASSKPRQQQQQQQEEEEEEEEEGGRKARQGERRADSGKMQRS